MNKAIIIIPEDGNNLDVTTNGIHLYTIVNSLHNLQRALCQQLVKQAKNAVGNDPKAQEKYLDNIIRQLDPEKKGPSGNNIINNN
jgi:hypothetical protein